MRSRTAFALLCIAIACAFAIVCFARAETTSAAASEAPSKSPVSDQPDLEQLQSALESKGEKHEFQAEITKLLGILINSLYTNKDIFLRELISNASDALDKIRFLSLTDKDALKDEPELEVRIFTDPEKNTLTIRDTGIGMTKEDLMSNLGVIAKSGTKAFLEKLEKNAEDSSNLIGQFGVGFYSAFLAADRVTVATKHNDDPDQYVWSSTADGSFTIAKDPRGNTLKRGTEITLQLKEDSKQYANPEELKKLIEKYSEFIQFPIHLWVTKTETVTVPDESEEDTKKDEEKAEEEKKPDTDDEDSKKDEEKEDEEKVDVEEESEDEKKDSEEPKMKTITVDKSDWEIVNKNKPIWTREPSEVTKEEYHSFYKAISKDFADPLTYTHFKAEGNAEFRAILYIPGVPPYDMFDVHRKSANIKLYVKRVFITDQIADMMPRYLNFVRGVVDSEDLPLHVSRELLQDSKLLKMIQRRLVHKTLGMIKKLSDADLKSREEPEDEKKDETEKKDEDDEFNNPMLYQRFWKDYGKNIRLGIIEDTSNRHRLVKFLRYYSTKSRFMLTSLDEYIKRMKPNQKYIYYIAAQSLEEAQASPFLEELNRRDIEVLFFVDAIDEYMIQNVFEYDGKELMNVARDGLELPEEDEEAAKKRDEELNKEFKPLIDFFKEMLGDKVQKVSIGKRLAKTPLAIVSPRFGFSANMLRVMQAQTLSGQEQEQMANMASKLRNVEFNPHHPIIKSLNARVAKDSSDPLAKSTGDLLYQAALLRSGFDIGDTAQFADSIFSMVEKSIGEADSAPDTNDAEAEDPTADTTQPEEETTTPHDEL